MENVKLVRYMTLPCDVMWPLRQKLMDETEMVSFAYSAVAYILLGPWLYGPPTASLTL
jgi:hypothetical protein